MLLLYYDEFCILTEDIHQNDKKIGFRFKKGVLVNFFILHIVI